MAMRPQNIDQDVSITGTTASNIAAGTQIALMSRATGTNSILADYRAGLGTPQKTKATEFIVIEHVGSSPWILQRTTPGASWASTTGVLTNPGAVNIKINSTEYFINPDSSRSTGVSGFASPFPKSTAYQTAFEVNPDVYVLPGQNWELIYTTLRVLTANTTGASTQASARVWVYCKYTLYDGSDAVIANKLLGMGIAVKPENVDWFKRKVLEKEGKV